MTENKPLINLEHVQLKQTVTQKHNNKEEDVIPFISRGIRNTTETPEMYNTCAMDSLLFVFGYVLKNNSKLKNKFTISNPLSMDLIQLLELGEH